MAFRDDSAPIFSHTVDLQQEYDAKLQQEYDAKIRIALVSAKSRVTKVHLQVIEKPPP